MALIQAKRGTRAQLDSAAGASGLNIGEPYLISDEGGFAVGTGTSGYAEAIMAPEVTTVASAGSSQTITLAATRPAIYRLTLDAATCTITASASGSGYSAALVLLLQDATGSRAVSWAGSPIELGAQSLNVDAGAYSAWLLWTPDGGTTLFLSPAGAEA